jgi:hypothetical protein
MYHRARADSATASEPTCRPQPPNACRTISRPSYDLSTSVDLISSTQSFALTTRLYFTSTHSFTKLVDLTLSLGPDKRRGFSTTETAWHGPNTKDGSLLTRPSCTVDIHTMHSASKRHHWSLHSYDIRPLRSAKSSSRPPLSPLPRTSYLLYSSYLALILFAKDEKVHTVGGTSTSLLRYIGELCKQCGVREKKIKSSAGDVHAFDDILSDGRLRGFLRRAYVRRYRGVCAVSSGHASGAPLSNSKISGICAR